MTANDKLAALHDRLSAQVEALVDSQDWRAFLAVVARFHLYSANNVFLILSQMPTATRVAGYRRWLSLGRQVRRGETGLAILAPCVSRARCGSRPSAPAGCPATRATVTARAPDQSATVFCRHGASSNEHAGETGLSAGAAVGSSVRRRRFADAWKPAPQTDAAAHEWRAIHAVPPGNESSPSLHLLDPRSPRTLLNVPDRRHGPQHVSDEVKVNVVLPRVVEGLSYPSIRGSE